MASPSQQGYSYDGPRYEIVVTDENVGPANLTQYWIYSPVLDATTADFRKQAKQVLTDVARRRGDPGVSIEIVSDKEIAEAEATSTMMGFIEEHGQDYAVNRIPQKEKAGWLASYRGGLDGNDEPSDAADAFQVIWLPYGAADIENWKPAASE